MLDRRRTIADLLWDAVSGPRCFGNLLLEPDSHSDAPSTHPARLIGLGLAVLVLLSAHWLLAVSSVREKSPTFDEIAHLTNGVAIWKTGDYRLFPPHPPLAHLWAAAPLIASGFNFPDSLLDLPDWRQSRAWNLGRRFFYACGNHPQSMLTRGRAAIALLSVALALVVWLWSRKLFGEVGGIISLILFAFSPTILAHARLVTTDVAAALFFLLAVAAVWWVLHRISPLSIVLSALAVAGLLLSKMSGLMILPIAGVLIAIRLLSNRPTVVVFGRPREIRSRPAQLGAWLLMGLVHGAIVVLVIWAAFGLRYSAMKHARPGRDRLPPGLPTWDRDLSELGSTGRAICWMRDRRLLPEAYLFGLAYTLHHAEARPAFLNGQMRRGGWWYYFPYCFAVKTPLPLFGILLMALIAVGMRLPGRSPSREPTEPDRRSKLDGLYRTAPLWTLLVVYGFFAMRAGLNIGHRHLLPIYPVLFIFAGRTAAWLQPGRRLMRWVPPALVVLFLASSLRTWPHYLAYFNTLIGGPDNAWKHLVDSSLDWGQDLPGLSKWLRHNAPQPTKPSPATATPPVYLSYGGTALPAAYGVEARALPGFPGMAEIWMSPLTGGVYCISASMLQQYGLLSQCRWTRSLEKEYHDLYPRFAWARGPRRTSPAAARSAALTKRDDDHRRFCKLRFARLCAFLRQRSPDDHIGHSILIYKLSDDDIKRALEGEPAELLPDPTP